MSADTVPIVALVISSLIIVALFVILSHNLKEAPFCAKVLRAQWQNLVRSLSQPFGADSAWNGYVGILIWRFNNTSRTRQEEYILRLSQAVTIGSAALVLSFVYQFFPTLARALVLPIVLAGAYFVSSKVVAPVVIRKVLD